MAVSCHRTIKNTAINTLVIAGEGQRPGGGHQEPHLPNDDAAVAPSGNQDGTVALRDGRKNQTRSSPSYKETKQRRHLATATSIIRSSGRSSGLGWGGRGGGRVGAAAAAVKCRLSSGYFHGIAGGLVHNTLVVTCNGYDTFTMMLVSYLQYGVGCFSVETARTIKKKSRPQI